MLVRVTLGILATLWLSGCGSDEDPLQRFKAGGDSRGLTGDGDATPQKTPEPVEEEQAADNPEGEIELPPIEPGEYEIPGADAGDLDALHKCLAKWKELPFDKVITNYRAIPAAVSVLGMGTVISDTEPTEEPELVLITAAVNVLGSPVYELMNPNGFYCIKVNVNAVTKLTINLHCQARLADSKVNVNVFSNQNDSSSAVGVHVLSDLQVKTVRPEGAECIR